MDVEGIKELYDQLPSGYAAEKVIKENS